jgi:CheY-like chemotaxis protein
MKDKKNNNLKILIADDDSDDRLFIKEALEKIGILSLFFVKNGEEVMDFLGRSIKGHMKSIMPDILITDINMPKKDGFETIKEIKAIPALKSIKICILTTSTTSSDKQKAKLLNVDGFISKVNAFPILVKEIEGFLNSVKLVYCNYSYSL